MERVDGWAARTDAPLGAIPFMLGAAVSAVIAIVFTSTAVVPVAAWAAFALCSCVLALRAIRWTINQMDALQIERETEQMLEREPRLVPLYHAPRWDERKAS
jgi:hypothetical protein